MTLNVRNGDSFQEGGELPTAAETTDGWVAIIFSNKFYAPQKKILEGRTRLSERDFEALFNVL
jgi:hypothetical protein